MAHWLSAPLWPFQIFTGHKAFTNPLLASERLNRRGLYAARVALAARLAARRRRKLAHLVSDEARADFAQKGAIVTAPVAGDELAALRAEVAALEAPAYEMREGDAITRRMPLPPEVLARAPRLSALLASPAFQGPIRYVGSFDMAPDLFIQTIFTQVSGANVGGRDPQNTLHMDTFHSTVKAWLWLDDVTEEMGPFAYVFGSHKVDQRRLAWHKRRSVMASTGGARGGSFRVSEAERVAMRLPEPHRFVVPAGTFVVGDTFGFHRRTRASAPSTRIEIWASLRPNPFYPFVSNWFWPPRVLAGREPGLFLRFAEWAHRRGLRARRDWFAVGTVRPSDPPRHPDLSA